MIVTALAAGFVAVSLVGIATPASAVASVDCKKEVHGPDLEAARIILKVGRNLHARPRIILSAFETAWVESRVNNCFNGYGTSVGVFQQINAWGTFEQRTDVRFAARSYYKLAIVYFRAHRDKTAGQIAQAVQRSAFTLRYDQCQATANALLLTTTRKLERELALKAASQSARRLALTRVHSRG